MLACSIFCVSVLTKNCAKNMQTILAGQMHSEFQYFQSLLLLFPKIDTNWIEQLVLRAASEEIITRSKRAAHLNEPFTSFSRTLVDIT